MNHAKKEAHNGLGNTYNMKVLTSKLEQVLGLLSIIQIEREKQVKLLQMDLQTIERGVLCVCLSTDLLVIVGHEGLTSRCRTTGGHQRHR
jgi:hypothetical protein